MECSVDDRISQSHEVSVALLISMFNVFTHYTAHIYTYINKEPHLRHFFAILLAFLRNKVNA